MGFRRSRRARAEQNARRQNVMNEQQHGHASTSARLIQMAKPALSSIMQRLKRSLLKSGPVSVGMSELRNVFAHHLLAVYTQHAARHGKVLFKLFLLGR